MANQHRTAHSRENRKAVTPKQSRQKPGSTGKGEYYHIEVLPKSDFISFQTQDVGRRGHIQRVAGQRASGYWSTVKWLIDKDEAHVQDNKLVPDTKAARDVLEQLGSEPVRMLGDLFKAKPRPSFRAEPKPVRTVTRARRETPRKVQTARGTRKKN